MELINYQGLSRSIDLPQLVWMVLDLIQILFEYVIIQRILPPLFWSEIHDGTTKLEKIFGNILRFTFDIA